MPASIDGMAVLWHGRLGRICSCGYAPPRLARSHYGLSRRELGCRWQICQNGHAITRRN